MCSAVEAVTKCPRRGQPPHNRRYPLDTIEAQTDKTESGFQTTRCAGAASPGPRAHGVAVEVSASKRQGQGTADLGGPVWGMEGEAGCSGQAGAEIVAAMLDGPSE